LAGAAACSPQARNKRIKGTKWANCFIRELLDGFYLDKVNDLTAIVNLVDKLKGKRVRRPPRRQAD
jgi:hypothetical protein